MTFGGFTPFTLIDYPGKTAAMVYTLGCNFRCSYCHNPDLVNLTNEDVYDENEIISFLLSRRGKLDGLVITGGEPTIHKDLLPFLARVKDLGFLVKLDSNGTNPGVLEEAVLKGLVDYLAMDIKAPLPAYPTVTRRTMRMDPVERSMRLLMDSGVDYEFRTTIVRSLLSLDDIEAIAESISGAKRYFLQKFIPTTLLDPRFMDEDTYTDDEFAELKRRVEKHVAHCGVR